ncbi:MAG: autoinducer binding domain-containing protein [Candidatus Pseudomonas phytovorans]|uniref:Autoinducer binding domain-containing protein n=1 Tax=Candidatus Pseudomonas phytovorans TaxID=3121377 RepID=A0AAJ5WK91_9PSED|nr:autoinducer binding domain-containing protein [Pseudomonas sp.]WEK31364.1 MAG: autoinducer binding domain-containing protein [Pseudomonas sp.]
MDCWQIELLHALERAGDENVIFALIMEASLALDFNYCAYGLQVPYPLSSPKAIMLNNYSASWQERYSKARYLESDPTILLGRQSERPILWSDQLYAKTPELWEEARGHGLHNGLSQSMLNTGGSCAMFTVARSEAISERELHHNGDKLRWLASTAHASLSSILNRRHRSAEAPELTEREREVLKWTADGKSASEIADLLTLSKNTIDFHIKNAVRKLKTANKTAAVVRAAMLGLLF